MGKILPSKVQRWFTTANRNGLSALPAVEVEVAGFEGDELAPAQIFRLAFAPAVNRPLMANDPDAPKSRTR